MQSYMPVIILIVVIVALQAYRIGMLKNIISIKDQTIAMQDNALKTLRARVQAYSSNFPPKPEVEASTSARKAGETT